jgi:nicotinate-nucleotide--dimethylbenzimidazole phosphoribosyltransferase
MSPAEGSGEASAWLELVAASLPPLDLEAMRLARLRQATLTKPEGSLGRLEELSIRVAGMCATARPVFRRPAILVLAADHGVVAQGVSAYPQSVTAEMVRNFLRGGAAINVLSRHVGARVIVVDMGVADELGPLEGLAVKKVGRGTEDMSIGPAMSRQQAQTAIQRGFEVAEQEIASGADLLGLGEMGIGNTTAASAITAVITGATPAQVTGRGTGLKDEGLAAKIEVIERTVSLHRPSASDALDVLTRLGGFEIGGLAGAILSAASRRVPVVLDGFITGAAALIAVGLAPCARDYLIASHRSVEVGHAVALEHLGLEPLLDLDLRLGEGTGAALGMNLVQAAAKILHEMATFDEAGVSGAKD